MRIIDAVWEKRNLGIETKEIEFEETDDIAAAKDCLQEIHAEYIVVKVPTSRADITHLLYEHQYEYIEDMILLINNLKTVKKLNAIGRLYDAVSIKKADEEDIEEVFTEIRKGMFSTDRISLDKYFSKEIAAERDVNWSMDDLDRGAELHNFIYKGKNIGFVGFKEIGNGVYTSFLGGIYNEYRLGGIGMVTELRLQDSIKKLGGKQLYTMVSSNNIRQVKNLTYDGYYVSKIKHIFIKHKG